MEKRNPWMAACFGVYCALALWLLFHREGWVEGLTYWEKLGQNLNLTPLRTVCLYLRYIVNQPGGALIPHAVCNLAGNVALFMPLGFFLPELWAGARKLWKTLLWTVLIVSIVELLQLVTLLGVCDIDDVILNTAGAAAGYGMFCLHRKRRKS